MTYPGPLRKFRPRKALVVADYKYDTHEPARGFHHGPVVKKTLPAVTYFLFSSTIS